MDDLPLQLRNSLDSVAGETVIQVADADAETLLAQWVASRCSNASGSAVGPVWVRGLLAEVTQPGSADVPPQVVVSAGVGYSVEIWGNKPYSRRFESTTPTAVDVNFNAAAALIAVTSVGVEALPLSSELAKYGKDQRFYYAPASSAIETVVPLALVELNAPDAGAQFGSIRRITDMRLPALGYKPVVNPVIGSDFGAPRGVVQLPVTVSSLTGGAPFWSVPFLAYKPTSRAIEEFGDRRHIFPEIENKIAEWVPLCDSSSVSDSFYREKFPAPGLGAWVVIPRGYEVEVGFSLDLDTHFSLFEDVIGPLTTSREFDESARIRVSITPLVDGLPTTEDQSNDQTMDTNVLLVTRKSFSPQAISVSATFHVGATVPGVHFISIGFQVEADLLDRASYHYWGTPITLFSPAVVYAAQIRVKRIRAFDV